MDQSTPQVPSKKYGVIIALLIVGFISAFMSGFVISHVLTTEQPLSPSPTPTLAPQLSGDPQDTTKFLPGKFYFQDTIIAVSKNNPHVSLLATVSRTEQESRYSQNTRVSYFDGTNWFRDVDNKITKDSTIVSSLLVNKWVVALDPSRVLKETASGQITIHNTPISFKTETLTNELTLRSLPGYTKFISATTGTLTIDGVEQEAYVLYTRIYSLNAKDIQFYNQSLGVTTDWLAFWDENGNFYHLDSTVVSRPTPVYASHQIGFLKTKDSTVLRTFDLSIERDTNMPPQNYTMKLNTPINDTLNLKLVSSHDKEPGIAYDWHLGIVTGMVNELTKGVGIVEYIKDH